MENVVFVVVVVYDGGGGGGWVSLSRHILTRRLGDNFRVSKSVDAPVEMTSKRGGSAAAVNVKPTHS